MKRTLVNCVLVIGSVLFAWLVGEGARALYFGSTPHKTFLSLALGPWWKTMPSAMVVPEFASVTNARELRKFIDEFKAVNGGLGNTDFDELVNESAAINGHGPCGGNKPNLDKSITQIRIEGFNSFDPPVFFVDHSTKLSPKLEAFLRKYGFEPFRFTTNSVGERTTLPPVKRKEKVLVVGDSVALGVSVDDEYTLASQLQKADLRREYVNVGKGGAGMADIQCLMNEAAKRYAGQISELIYVACDNDFSDSSAETPEGLLRRLKAFREAHGIGRLIVLRANYIYSNFPFREYPLQPGLEKVFSMGQALKSSGLPYADMMEVVLEEQRKRDNLFAGLEFYSDYVHWSKQGIATMAEKVTMLRKARP